MPNVCVLCIKPLLKYPSPRISFHVFPACPKKRQIWLKQCGLTNKKVLPNRKICSFHFEPTCFKSNVKRRILYSDAVPTIFAKSHVKTTKGRPKNCNKKRIIGPKLVSRNILPIKPVKDEFKCLKRSMSKDQKVELDEFGETITELKKKKLSFMSLLKLVRIQISLANGIK